MIRDYEPGLVGGSEDWEVVLGLKQRGAEALITCDDNMLFAPRVVAVIEQTRFTVVSCRAAGHDPVLATGILLAHLPRVMKRHRPDVAQVWRLTAVEQRPIPIKDQKAEVERRSGERVDDYKLSGQVLQEPLLPLIDRRRRTRHHRGRRPHGHVVSWRAQAAPTDPQFRLTVAE